MMVTRRPDTALHVSYHNPLASGRYSSGRTTGLVLDSGDGVTHSVPVFEGFSMPHAIRRIDLAGRDVTEQLQLLLRTAGYDMKTSAEKEVVRGLKEEGCYVRSATGSGSGGGSKDEVVRPEEFKLPDGNVIKASHRAKICPFKRASVSLTLALASYPNSWAWRGTLPLRFCSIRSSLALSTPASTSLSWTASTEQI